MREKLLNFVSPMGARVCRCWTTIGHHVSSDNVTGGHVKVTQVGSEDIGGGDSASGVLPVTVNSHGHRLTDVIFSNFLF